MTVYLAATKMVVTSPLTSLHPEHFFDHVALVVLVVAVVVASSGFLIALYFAELVYLPDLRWAFAVVAGFVTVVVDDDVSVVADEDCADSVVVAAVVPVIVVHSVPDFLHQSGCL